MSIADILDKVIAGQQPHNGKLFAVSDIMSKSEALAEIRQLILDSLPKRCERKPDEDYGYCITCNQIIDTLEADCFCSIHNLAIDQATESLNNLTKEGSDE